MCPLKMRKICFMLILVFYIFVTVIAVEKIICNSTHNIEINENEIIFFESPNFPQSIDKKIKENCKLIINGTSDKENMEIVLIFTKAKFKHGQITVENENNTERFDKKKYSKSGYHHTDDPYMIFDFSKKSIKSWEVFQGFITYEQGSIKSCPLANKDKPYKTASEDEPLYIRSSYNKDMLLYEKKCTWDFEAPENHAFKMKIQQLESEVLVVWSNERQWITRKGTYHFNATAITVSHTTTLNKNHTFEARISVVNLKKPHRQDDCIFIDDIKKKTAFWTREANDFDNVIKCKRNVTVVSGHQLYANITLYDLEPGIDALRYYDNDTELLHPIEILANDTYVFLPYSDGLNRSVTLEFTSDDSIIHKNFSVYFSSIECKCTKEDFVVPCDGEKTYTIMGGENDLYCANLTCSSTIQIHDSCPDKLILLKLYQDFANPDCDYIHLVNENEVLINTSDISTRFVESTIQTALILPNRSTFFAFESFPGTRIDKVSGAVINVGIGRLRFWTKALEVPKPQYQTITAADPLYIFKSEAMKGNSVLTVTLSDDLLAQNDTLELVYETSNAQHLLKCLTLYDNEDLSSIRKLNLFNYTIDIGTSITIYKHINCEKDISKLIIRPKYAHSVNCVFQNNLINVENIMKTKNKIISMIAGSQRSCDLTLVNNVGQYFIKQIWTKNEDSILLYNNAIKNETLLKFNKATAAKWKQMTFNALSYTLKIPANSSVILEFFVALYKVLLNSSHSSYYETPFYGTQSFKPVSHNTTYYLPRNLNVNLTVTDIQISSKAKLQLLFAGNSIDLKTIPSTTISGNDDIFVIYYYEPELGYKGAMINFEVYEKQKKKNFEIFKS